MLAGRGFQPEAIQQRRVIVAALHNRVVARARGGDARPAHDAGHADAALEDRRLAAAQRAVARRHFAVHLAIHIPAVVRGEDDDGAVSELQSVERVEQRADGVVHALDHRGVGRAALGVGGVGKRAIFLDERLLRIERRVDAEHPVVEVKGVALVFLHERDGLLRHAILDVLVGHAGVVVEVLELPRRDVTARRPRPRPMRHIDIEALLQRGIRLGAEMPFAEVPGRVAGGLQRFRERRVFGFQPRRRLGLNRLLPGGAAVPGVASRTT